MVLYEYYKDCGNNDSILYKMCINENIFTTTDIINYCNKHGIKMTNNQVDIGVRVEVRNEIMERVKDVLYKYFLKHVSIEEFEENLINF